jgi:hypothetical protein
MQVEELEFQNLVQNLLKPYKKRAATESAQFLRWFPEIHHKGPAARCWPVIAGAVYRIDDDGKKAMLIDLDMGSAELEYIPNQSLLIVPTG